MGLIYESCRKLYYFLSPLARKQMKIERMLMAMENQITDYEHKVSDINSNVNTLKEEILHIRKSAEGEQTLFGTKLEAIENEQRMLLEVLNLSRQEENLNREIKADAEDYLNMQRNQYNDERTTPEDIVGQYEWHENYPYETFLLYRNGDVRKPIFENTSDKTALDFACGPGRMVKRMSQIFKHVDGCDISERMLEVAKERVPECTFYLTNGDDLGEVPKNHYDFVYCTISMQHIASYDIRRNILTCIKEALKDGGKFTLQLAYNKDFPYVNIKGKMIINENEITVAGKQPMASYFSNDFGAEVTNGAHDVGIGERDLDAIKADFSSMFNNVAIWYSNVSNYYSNLEGFKHGNYWATDWIYIYGENK